MDLEDQALVQRAQQGDQDAFALLVTRHQRYVYNLAYRLLRDTHEAQDLAQEAFLRAWRGLGRFRAKAKFTTWLYRIVANLCYNRLPGLRRQIANADLDSVDARVPSLDTEPPLAFDAAEQRAYLRQQIAALPPKYQLVITLFYVQDLSYRDIALVLDLPIGTVKTHLYRAREQLKRRLQEKMTDPRSR